MKMKKERCLLSTRTLKTKIMKHKLIITLILFITGLISAQIVESDSLKSYRDSLDYKKYYDCDYNKGNVLIVMKKGKKFTNFKELKTSKNGFTVRMEAIYSMEFDDGARYESSIVKDITKDSISITNFYNENAARVAGKTFQIIKYPLSSIKYIRFINDRLLSIYSKKNLQKNFDLIVETMDHAKMCPAIITFKNRNGETKVCHYYLTDQGYNLLYEDAGKIYYLEGRVEWK